MAKQGDTLNVDAMVQQEIATIHQKGKDHKDSLTLDGIRGSKRAHVSESLDSNKGVPQVGRELTLVLVEPNPKGWKKVQKRKKNENISSSCHTLFSLFLLMLFSLQFLVIKKIFLFPSILFSFIMYFLILYAHTLCVSTKYNFYTINKI